MEDRITVYFEKRIADCQAAMTALNADNRTDEAVFEKIRMNVFTIFQQVYAASAQASGSDAKKRLDFLNKRLHDIPSAWETSLGAAQRHLDVQKAHIEQIKLAAATEILQQVTEWSEET